MPTRISFDSPPNTDTSWHPQVVAGTVFSHAWRVDSLTHSVRFLETKFVPDSANRDPGASSLQFFLLGSNRTRCPLQIFSKYAILVLGGILESNGDSLLVFKKNDTTSLSPDNGISDTVWFASTNTDQIFYDLQSHYMLLDYGTSPDWRSFEVLDLDTRRIVFEDGYINSLSFSGVDSIYYATSSPAKPSDPHYPSQQEWAIKLAEWDKESLGHALVEDFVVDLRTRTKFRTQNIYYLPTQ